MLIKLKVLEFAFGSGEQDTVVLILFTNVFYQEVCFQYPISETTNANPALFLVSLLSNDLSVG